jgi:hypothetical protein
VIQQGDEADVPVMGTASPDKKTSSSAFIATSAQSERPVAKRSAKVGAHRAIATESGNRGLAWSTSPYAVTATVIEDRAAAWS